MEPQTITECDLLLDSLDRQLGIYRAIREHNESMEKIYRTEREMADKQVNITKTQMDLIHKVKDRLCNTFQMESKSNSENSSPSNVAKFAEGVYEPETQAIINADHERTLSELRY